MDLLNRDWRGLADLMGYNQEDISSFQCTPDPTLSVLRKWSECEGTTVKMFLLFLEKMDRFDVFDDIIMLVSKFAIVGLLHTTGYLLNF